MESFVLNPHTAYQISVAFILISSFVSGLELVMVPNIHLDFVYQTTSVQHKSLKWQSIHGLQVAVALFVATVLIAGLPIWLFKGLFVLLTLINLYAYTQRITGKDGSDQFRILALLAFSICFLINDAVGERIALGFVAIQVLIGYATAGLAKLASEHWRKGNVLAGIMSTSSYGVPAFATFLQKHPQIEKLLSHGAIAVMLAVPITFCLPFQTPLVCALVMMFFFHGATALLMGLNDFLLTYPLSYPGIWLLHNYLFNI